MRYISFLILFGLVLFENINSQEQKFTVRTGIGYYADYMGMYDGPAIWVEGGYKLKTGFFLNGRFSVSSIDWKMSSGTFKGYQTLALRQMFDFTFSKPIKLKGTHFLEPGLGIKLKREYSLYPDYSIDNISGTNYTFTRYSDIFYEIGFTVCVDYYYQFTSGFYIGLRADTNVIWALGFEGLTISPLFGFRF